MSVGLFTFIRLFDKQLGAALHLLDKGAAHLGTEAEVMLDWRLVEDMHPLRFQLRTLANFSRSWPARVAGLEPPAEVPIELDLNGFRAALADARSWLAALRPEQLAGRDDVPLKVLIAPGLEPTMTAGEWLSGFAATNIYFHLSIAYAILRAHGVPIGKVDLFAGGL